MASPSATTSNDAKTLPKEKFLQPEFNALTHCLKDAVIKTGQIYSFYAEARKLDIEKHVPNPPRSLTAALGRDIEKYDQLCDSIEAHLLRAISILKRDLRREEERIETEERRKQQDALKMLPPPVPPPTSDAFADAPSHTSIDGSGTNPRNSPIFNPLPGRRPSAISISSLHRPQFPLKLDLSSTSLRITEEEAALYSKGLPSPVTLAPKSARPTGPNESFPDLMSAFADSTLPIDITHSSPNLDLSLPDGMHIPQKQSDLTVLGVGLGDSSDKPIELDLDAMDIEMANMTDHFGDPIEPSGSSNTHDGLFSPIMDNGDAEQMLGIANDEPGQDKGTSLAEFEIDNVNDELFGDFTSSGGELELAPGGSVPQPQSLSMSSPEILLAQFTSAPDLMEVKNSPSVNSALQQTGETFDLNSSMDLISNLASGFFSDAQNTEMNFSMDMETFLNMDSGDEPKGNAHTLS
ncbi:hypothetical protein GALMADRAFT_233971 [Galerina marginata CBS 339.88]|uniref:Uncharacterized protein n=1 Tax=Galerina marginata (strain CBS 339.88) TaxID=685588 RepID=A0A067TYY9_GALM3|nr:hypothetical protein GALMADRAFT_233971 [Galerina marginata CBS 339.88]